MQLKIDFPTAQIVDIAKRAATSLDRSRQAVQQKVAGVLQGLILDAFQTKSRGGKGSDGIQWLPDKPETMQHKRSRLIGVESGGMLASLKVQAAGSHGGAAASPDVTAAFTADHAMFFDQARQLLPDGLPQSWANALEAPAREWAEKTIQAQTETKGPFLGGI